MKYLPGDIGRVTHNITSCPTGEDRRHSRHTIGSSVVIVVGGVVAMNTGPVAGGTSFSKWDRSLKIRKNVLQDVNLKLRTI
jgi:hypothetical protein